MQRRLAPVVLVAAAVVLAGFATLGRRWARRRAEHGALAEAYVRSHAQAMRAVVASVSSSGAAEPEPDQRVEAREGS